VRTDLLQALLSGIVFLGAFFAYVHWVLGVDITGLLATSAVLSVIVGFALQATLGNVFAGISIELEHRVRVGDFVRRGALGGEVIALSWRSVHVRSENGSILVVPNSAITSDVLKSCRGTSASGMKSNSR
jgi:small-conductance mechanosensitive channel